MGSHWSGAQGDWGPYQWWRRVKHKADGLVTEAEIEEGVCKLRAAKGCGPGRSWEREGPCPPLALPVDGPRSQRLGKAHTERTRLRPASSPVKSHAFHAHIQLS